MSPKIATACSLADSSWACFMALQCYLYLHPPGQGMSASFNFWCGSDNIKQAIFAFHACACGEHSASRIGELSQQHYPRRTNLGGYGAMTGAKSPTVARRRHCRTWLAGGGRAARWNGGCTTRSDKKIHAAGTMVVHNTAPFGNLKLEKARGPVAVHIVAL